jgi:hypothetical protein
MFQGVQDFSVALDMVCHLLTLIFFDSFIVGLITSGFDVSILALEFRCWYVFPSVNSMISSTLLMEGRHSKQRIAWPNPKTGARSSVSKPVCLCACRWRMNWTHLNRRVLFESYFPGKISVRLCVSLKRFVCLFVCLGLRTRQPLLSPKSVRSAHTNMRAYSDSIVLDSM